MFNILTGLKFSLLRGSFFLCKSNTWPTFRLWGNFEVLKVSFIRQETVWIMAGPHDFKIFAEILSTPVAFLILRFEIILEAWFVFTDLNENWGRFSGRISWIFLILGWSENSGSYCSPPPCTYVFCHIHKKVVEMAHTSVRSVTTLPLSDNTTGVPPSCPFLERNGLMVGQKSLDFGPPAQRS